MKKHLSNIFLVILIALTFIQCAKRGRPTGGPLDEQPPVILRAFPDNYSRNFKNQVIEIEFDEFVKLKDLQKQLVISPPLKTRPIISPQGSASKKITIEITDTLQDNTTYVLNFGESIVDNNEENPYPFYKYVFSTGNVIDSLTLKGKITDALNYKAEEFVSVLLYEVNETYTDSVIYKESPRYVLNTLDSLTTFTMENLKEGTYKMVALKEKNSDLKFDPKRDKIGFVSGTVSVPSDKVHELRMYQQELDPSIKRITQQAESRLYVGYTGNIEDLIIEPIQKKSLIQQSRLTQLEKKDTLQYWYRPKIEQDSAIFTTTLEGKVEEFNVRLKELDKDSLVIKKGSEFSLRNAASFTASTPIEKIDMTLMKLIDKDSVEISFTTRLDSLKNKAYLDFEKKEEQKYNLTMLPGTFTDFYGEMNTDTLSYNYTTKKENAYGNFSITLSGGSSFPVIIQVTKKDLTIEAELSVNENGTYDIFYLNPGDYYIRVVYDTNGNGKYDPGNFLKGLQPEEVVYNPELIQLQANWDRRYTLNLK
ncbi:MAG: Ig-like domain-containing protein [Nonlabens sp.]|uniref:Ig-like domain-containing protein n=1 Tax=Nonlabens sp. TaxID=1888209 RepID=UPI003219561B